VKETTFLKSAPCEASAAPILAKARRAAALVHAHLAGDEQKFRRLDAGEVGIGRDRLADAVGIEHLDIGHVRLRAARLASKHSAAEALCTISVLSPSR